MGHRSCPVVVMTRPGAHAQAPGSRTLFSETTGTGWETRSPRQHRGVDILRSGRDRSRHYLDKLLQCDAGQPNRSSSLPAVRQSVPLESPTSPIPSMWSSSRDTRRNLPGFPGRRPLHIGPASWHFAPESCRPFYHDSMSANPGWGISITRHQL